MAAPLDAHCHLRDGKMLGLVVHYTAQQFPRAVVMPNTNPPILTGEDVWRYRREIKNCYAEFEPLMTFQITDKTTPEIVAVTKNAGAIAGKVYPQGVTTNSHNGVTDFDALAPVLQEMQRQNMLLLLHGEDPDPKTFCLDREKEFLLTLHDLAEGFPELKIVLEHITTAGAVDAVMNYPNVAATITAHHLVLTLNDVVGGLISPHNFCKPLAKRPEDRKALLNAATSGNPKFFGGTDSAPHLKSNKECSHGCAGCFTAPVALQLYAQVFEEQNALDRLEGFASKFGANFYGLPQSQKTIELIKEDWEVPPECCGIVPFMACKVLRWRVA